MGCEVNLRGRRLGPRALRPTQVAAFYIESPVPKALHDCATPRLYEDGHRTCDRERQRRRYYGGPQRRCSIHDRPICPFSADDCPKAARGKGSRPVGCEINSRSSRFGPRSVGPTQADEYSMLFYLFRVSLASAMNNQLRTGADKGNPTV